ncbi:MAG: marine proteobacterial sortase target protein [Burkholderiaceae bacterium]
MARTGAGEAVATSPTEARDASGGAARFSWIDWLGLLGYAVATAIAIGCALGLAVALTASAAMAAEPGARLLVHPLGPLAQADTEAETASDTEPAQRTTGLLPAALAALPRLASAGDTRGAGLLFRTTHGLVLAPTQSTDARLIVTGATVRARVRQRFANPSEDWLEGVYVFPLPEDAAIDHLTMHVGDRVIEGEIRERQAARREYRRAADSGRRASLVEQQRPNLFTTQVAYICPWSSIDIEIEYQQNLALRDGVWRLRFPSVVGPRYAAHTPDAAEITAPTFLPGEPPPAPLKLTVRIDAGVPVGTPRSSTHVLAVRAGTRLASAASLASAERDGSSDEAAAGSKPSAAGAMHYDVRLAGPATPDRDFELEWAPLPGREPAAGFRVEKHGRSWYGQLVLSPPMPATTPETRLPRETTFIVDTSGSMAGNSIAQARRALEFALERLHPGDRFNLIRFSDRHESLFPAPRAFDPATHAQARAWVRALEANGGTEMRGAIEAALSAPASGGHVGQVIFLTDGAVGYEDQMMQLIAARLGKRRLYTIGIGSAPNSWFMRKAAESGGGSFTYIGRVADVERRMSELFAKLAQPLLTDVTVHFVGADPVEAPTRMPDLHAGDPVIVQARFGSRPSAVRLEGIRASTHWSTQVDARDADAAGLHVLWARAQVTRINDRIRFASADPTQREALRVQMVALGIEHHLVTPQTSLVAVDRTPARPDGAPLRRAKVPNALPAGWQHAAVFGNGTLAQGATPAGLHLLTGLGLLAIGVAAIMFRRRRGTGAPIAPAFDPASGSRA